MLESSRQGVDLMSCVACHSFLRLHKTNFLERTSTREVDSSWAYQEMSPVLWNSKIHYHAHKNPYFKSPQSQPNALDVRLLLNIEDTLATHRPSGLSTRLKVFLLKCLFLTFPMRDIWPQHLIFLPLIILDGSLWERYSCRHLIRLRRTEV
jgi:hypothetical protein